MAGWLLVVLGLVGLPEYGQLPAPPDGQGYYVVGRVGPGLDQLPAQAVAADDRQAIVALAESAALAAKAQGYRLKPLSRIARPIGPAAGLALPGGPDSVVARVVAAVSADSLMRTIRELEAFGTRYSYDARCESAAFYLQARLQALGFAVRLDTYYLTAPRTRAFNIEATLVGVAHPESIVIACGHYDSYSSNTSQAPGADDDGTGVAAVLELARVMADARCRWSVKYLLFSGEEQWMKGSYHWVDSTAVPQGLAIAGVYNLDMFGYTAHDSNLLYVTRNAASLPLAVLAESVNGWYGLGLATVNFLDEDCAGDNTPFWEHGYRAVFACEDSEWGIWNGSNPYYHTPYDTIGNLRVGQVQRTARLAAACVATLAGLTGATVLAESQCGLPAPRVGRPAVVGADGRRFAGPDRRGLPAGVYFEVRPGERTRKLVRLR
jgi:hypothetical protein